jgi:triacylglycerol lipase
VKPSGLLVPCVLSLSLAAAAPGTLRYGAIPAGSSTKPVLLFVHGWNSDSSTWSGSNGMEQYAGAGGYRTAFLDVHPDQSMWTNAPLISAAGDQIRTRFTGAQVVLVCHSKGGVDGHTAIAYFGADAKLSRFITLGSPHYGTPLADLAWSSGASWLASLIGMRNEGNRVLQTGYMAAFRNQTDARPQAQAVPLFTAGGTKAGPLFSSYWFGGVAIGRTSDGVVPLDSSGLPYQRARLFTRSWNHDEVKQGGNAWPYLSSSLAAPAMAAADAVDRPVMEEPELDLAFDRLYRGGETHSGMAEFTFPVDASQPNLQVLLQTSMPPRQALLISPSGQAVRLQRAAMPLAQRLRPWMDPSVGESPEEPTGPFPGAVNSQIRVNDPEPGLWRVQLTASGEDAYFFTACFPADGNRRLPVEALRAVIQGRPDAIERGGQGSPRLERHSSRTTPAPGLRAGFREPVVANHTLVFTWPDGRERAVVFSEPEDFDR